MPPKRKAASKAKNVDTKSIEESMSNITVRKNKEEKNNEPTIAEKLYMLQNMSETSVVLEKMPDMITEIVEETENINEEPTTDFKQSQKKVIKVKKPKVKKDDEETSKTSKIKKRAASEDRTMIKAEANIVVKSRKRTVDKEPKSTSPINDLPKRNRRALSVDYLSSEVSTSQIPKKNRKGTTIVNEDGAPKKSKKITKKEQSNGIEKKVDELKVVEKITKGKKNGKKIPNEDNDNLLKLEENENEELPGVLQEKPKPKRGVKKEEIDAHVEIDQQKESIPATKNKRVGKFKINKPSPSPEKSDNSGDFEINSPVKGKIKRVRKVKEVEPKELKLTKRGKPKMQIEDVVEVPQKSSLTESEDELDIKTGDDLPIVGLSNTPESGNKAIKPTQVKRKIKAKTGKK